MIVTLRSVSENSSLVVIGSRAAQICRSDHLLTLLDRCQLVAYVAVVSLVARTGTARQASGAHVLVSTNMRWQR